MTVVSGGGEAREVGGGLRELAPTVPGFPEIPGLGLHGDVVVRGWARTLNGGCTHLEAP